MSPGDVCEVASVLAKRGECLDAVSEDGPVHKRDLVDSLDIPRTTLDRAVRELTDAGLVERADGGVRATGFGHEALAAVDRYRRTLSGLADAAPLLDALPEDTPLGAAFLRGATVRRATPPTPDRVLEDLFDSVDAGSVRGVAPVALTGHMDTFYEHARSGGAVPELVVTPAILDQLAELRADSLARAISDGDVDLLCGPIPFAFGLWLVDDAEAGVVVYTDTGVRGVAVNDTADALAWASEQYERVTAAADAVTPERILELRERGGD